MEIKSLKEYEETKREIALEIIEVFKSKDLSVALIDDVLEYAKKSIHNSARL